MPVARLFPALMVVCAGLLALAGSRETSIHYVPFSLETFYPMRKDQFEGLSYDVTSLFRPKLAAPDSSGELSRILALRGAPCSIDGDRIRLLLKTEGGKTLWMDSSGCREGNMLPGTSRTKLSPDDLVDLRRLFSQRMPPTESFSNLGRER